jgi:hypothetical protein
MLKRRVLFLIDISVPVKPRQRVNDAVHQLDSRLNATLADGTWHVWEEKGSKEDSSNGVGTEM